LETFETIRSILRIVVIPAKAGIRKPLDPRFRGDDRKQGFTFIEMAIVLGILAIVTAILLPTLTYWQRGRELRDGARSIRTALETARTKAMAQGHVYGVGFRSYAGERDRFVLVSLFGLSDPSDNEYGKSYMLPSSVRFREPLPGGGTPYLGQDTELTDLVGLIAFRTSGELEPRYLSSAAADPKIILDGPNEVSKTLTVSRITGKVTVA